MTENLHDRLRIARTQLGLTVEQAAKSAGVTRKTWERYEKGGNDPQASSLISLVERGVDPRWLLTGRGEMMGPPINDVWPAGPVDEALLEDVIGAVEQVLSERRSSMEPEKKAKLLKDLYMLVIEEGLEEEAKRGLVIRMARLAS